MPREGSGEFGGVVKRPFTGAGRDWRPNDEISAEVASTWPIANRMTLGRSGFIYWYAAPEGGDRLPETILVDLGDGTIVVARLGRDAETGGFIARVVTAPAESAPKPRKGRH